MVRARKEASQSGDQARTQESKLHQAFLNSKDILEKHGLGESIDNINQTQDRPKIARQIRNDILPTVRTEIIPAVESELAVAEEQLDNLDKDSRSLRDIRKQVDSLKKALQNLKDMDNAGQDQAIHRTQEALARHEKIQAKHKREDRIGKTMTDIGAAGIFTTMVSGGYALPVGFSMMAVGGIGAGVRVHHHARSNIIASEGKRLGNYGKDTDITMRQTKLAGKLVDAQADHSKLDEKLAIKGLFYKFRHKGKVEEAKTQSVDQARISRDNFQSPEAKRLLLASYMTHHSASETAKFMKDFYGLKTEKIAAIGKQLDTIDHAKKLYMEHDGTVERSEALEQAIMATAIYLAERIEHHRQ